MEDKRCPVCKKYNPPGEDTCLFCGNSLVPGENPSPPAYGGEEMEVPDWLKNFRDNNESGTQDAASSSARNEPVEHTPDWLQRIRDLNDNNPEGRPAYSESIGAEPVDGPDGDTQPVNPSGLQEWLTKLHRLENPKERSGRSFDRSPAANPENLPPLQADTHKPRDDRAEFSGDFIEDVLSKELTASPEEDMYLLEGAGQANLEQEFKNPAAPIEIKEESLMVEIDDYRSQSAESGGSALDLSGSAGSTVTGSSGPRSWMQKISGLFGGISFLKARKSAEIANEMPTGEATLPETGPDFLSTGADEEADSTLEETIPPYLTPEGVPEEIEQVDFHIEEGQKELALSAGLLDAPGELSGSVPDTESKEIPTGGQAAAQDYLSSPEILGSAQGDEVVAQFIPAAGSERLINLTDKQRAHRDLLTDLLREELEPGHLPEKQGKLTSRLLRWLIALIVIAGVALPLLTAGTGNLPAFVMPTSPQQLSFYQEIEAMAPNSPVLVAFDYEAAFSGEMRPIAVNVVEHLLKKNATVAFVSTLPAGAVMAEDVYSQAVLNSGAAGLESDDRYVNLGFMPGGVASLRQLAIQPQQASPYGLKSAMDKQPSWTKPVLQAVSNLNDFSMVIVMTDNIETGKAWLEQVQPALLETPLLLVTSAQAGPIMNPYLFSGQAQGMVSGYAGNLAYNQLLNKGLGSASAFMAYRSGMYLLLVALIIGGFLKIYNSILSAKPNDQGKGSM